MWYIYKDPFTPIAVPHRVALHGLCERDEPHESHVFPDPDVDYDTDGNMLLQECPGQYANCRNCDDRKCMDCVLRYWHDDCNHDCPMCCAVDTILTNLAKESAG